MEEVWDFYNKGDSNDPDNLILTETEALKLPGMKRDDVKEFLMDVDKDHDGLEYAEFRYLYYNIFDNNPPTVWW